MNTQLWKNPLSKYKMNVMFHRWPSDLDVAIDAFEAFHFAGVVTNVPPDNGFTENKKNLERFREIVEKLHERGFEYWIYDENGYPSGQAGGQTIRGRKDLVAKGLYMRKYEAFGEGLDFEYTVDGVSDGIVCAMKYKMDLSDVCEAEILFDSAQELPFSAKRMRVSLKPSEVCYIFICKDAYEGSHSVHNISSRNRYINILSDSAVKRFIEVAYSPVAETSEKAYPGCVGVFTDEPSLMTSYAREKETFNYALVPYEEKLFDRFASEYGYDIKKYLPLLFETTSEKCRQVRVDFYELIGKVVGEVYTGQLNEYCRLHGTRFSGHYLAEETVLEHVLYYGNYVQVLCKSGYPGMDILKCTPEDFEFNAPKFLEMVSRKMGSNGFMVELCPFFNIEVFRKKPFENVIGTLGLLYMNGARKIHTYYLPNLKEYDENKLSSFTGSMSREQSVFVNDYVGRMGQMLDETHAVYRNYVYYPVEDVQCKLVPKNHCGYFSDENLSKADRSLHCLAEILLTGGQTYGFADKYDLRSALLKRGDTLIIPDMDYIAQESVEAIKLLEERGVRILFAGTAPQMIGKEEKISGIGENCSYERILELLKNNNDFPFVYDGEKGLFFQRFANGVFMVYNNRAESARIGLKEDMIVYDPANGDNRKISSADEAEIASYRALFFK